MDKPVKTVFLLEDLCFGGTQKQTVELITRLNRKRFSPFVLTLTGPTDFDERLLNANVPLTHIGNKRQVPPAFFLQLYKYLKVLKPDILIPCTALPNIWGRIWGKILKIPVVIGTCRGGGAPKRQYERLLWHLTNHIICNSPGLIEVMKEKGIPQAHLTLINNGLDCEIFKPDSNPHEFPVILCVARLAQDKDHKTLIKAFEIVNHKYPYARLQIVGDGPEETNLKNFVANSINPQAREKIEFTGPTNSPQDFYPRADIFALASIQEGQPNAVMEAMGAELPVCATNVGGIPALVGNNGLLCEPGDFKALAQNLLFLLQNPEIRKTFGEEGRKKIQAEYSFNNMVSSHQNLFEKLWQNYLEQKS